MPSRPSFTSSACPYAVCPSAPTEGTSRPASTSPEIRLTGTQNSAIGVKVQATATARLRSPCRSAGTAARATAAAPHDQSIVVTVCSPPIRAHREPAAAAWLVDVIAVIATTSSAIWPMVEFAASDPGALDALELGVSQRDVPPGTSGTDVPTPGYRTSSHAARLAATATSHRRVSSHAPVRVPNPVRAAIRPRNSSARSEVNSAPPPAMATRARGSTGRRSASSGCPAASRRLMTSAASAVPSASRASHRSTASATLPLRSHADNPLVGTRSHLQPDPEHHRAVRGVQVVGRDRSPAQLVAVTPQPAERNQHDGRAGRPILAGG